MHKFFCTHTLPPGAFTPEQICQVAEASQHELDVKGYRSFFNLTKGKAWCVVEAKDREALVAWFKKMDIPYDSIDLVELEGERGTIEDLTQQPALAGVS
ncbi:MAG: nickel-binding protein [Thermoguttaceae bacterium]